jgi:3D (Asp-Asp-Asp) domain-containing protein
MRLKLLKIIVVFALIILSITGGIYWHTTTLEQLTKDNKIKEKILEKQYKSEYDKLQSLTDKVIIEKENSIMKLYHDIKNLKSYLKIKESSLTIADKINTAPNFKITAYDLSVNSCEKTRTSGSYGITASGYNLKNQSLRTASTIATDPRIIPLGTFVYIYFEEEPKFNGIYISSDVGGAIRGNHIDLFLGDYNSEQPSRDALNFGIKYAKVLLLDKIL